MNIFYGKTKTIILSIISILIAASTWVFNLGWLRLLFMTAVLIPHSILFFFMNLYSARYFDKSRTVKALNIIFIVTFLIAYVSMPDSDDISSYVFFGLLHNKEIVNIAEIVSAIAFVGHIVMLVMQIVGIEKIKKNILENK